MKGLKITKEAANRIVVIYQEIHSYNQLLLSLNIDQQSSEMMSSAHLLHQMLNEAIIDSSPLEFQKQLNQILDYINKLIFKLSIQSENYHNKELKALLYKIYDGFQLLQSTILK